MTPEQYAKFKQSLKQTQQRGAKMIARMDVTLLGVRDTLEKIEENNRKFQQFEQGVKDVMTRMAEKLAGTLMGNPFKKVEGQAYEDLPVELPVKQVVKAMLNHKQILIITGAGVSAPSGIPTFRGKNGFYDKKFEWENKEYEPEEFIAKHFYDLHPEPIWNWVQEIYQMAITLKPNKIHTLIDRLAKALSVRQKKVTVVTQNIDDLHLKPKNQYNYYGVHGNVKYVRCENNHLHNYVDFRKEIFIEKKIAKCPKCQLPLRPHVLFFDEKYGPLYGGEVKEKEFPFVFVIGTSLSTGLCANLTRKGKEVVEINPQPVIEVGKVYRFTKDTALTLTQFLKEMGESK